MKIRISNILRPILSNLGSSKFSFHRDRFVVNTLMNNVFRLPREVSAAVTRVALSKCNAYLVNPPNSLDGRNILFNHGGAMCFSMWKFYIPFIYRIAESTRSKVFMADYRLAPENPFPAGLEDCLGAYGWLRDSHGPRILVAGDSAGGNLALNVTIENPSVLGLVLMSPWLDLTHSGPSWQQESVDDVVFPVSARRAAWLYTKGSEAWTFGCDDPAALSDFESKIRNPKVSPVFADLNKVRNVPTLVQAGADERLLGDSKLLWEKLGAPLVNEDIHLTKQTVKLNYRGSQFSVWPGVPHVWQITRMSSRAAQEATKDIISFIENRFST